MPIQLQKFLDLAEQLTAPDPVKTPAKHKLDELANLIGSELINLAQPVLTDWVQRSANGDCPEEICNGWEVRRLASLIGDEFTDLMSSVFLASTDGIKRDTYGISNSMFFKGANDVREGIPDSIENLSHLVRNKITTLLLPESHSYRTVGEIAGDRPVKKADISLVDFAVSHTDEVLVFAVWHRKDTYRLDYIHGHEYSEHVTALIFKDGKSYIASPDKPWVSREDRPGWQVSPPDNLGQAKLDIQIIRGDVCANIKVPDSRMLHAFRALSSQRENARFEVPLYYEKQAPSAAPAPKSAPQL